MIEISTMEFMKPKGILKKVPFKVFLDLSPIHQKLLSALQQMNGNKLFYRDTAGTPDEIKNYCGQYV